MLFLWWSLGKTHKIFPTEASLPLYRNCSPFDRTRTQIRISPTPGFGFKLLSPLDETKVLEDSLKGPAAKLARVRILRACVLLALMLATALLGCFSYTTFAEADQVSFQDQFSASANLIKERLMSSFQIVRDSALEQSSIYTYEFQDEKQWPNITMSGFNEIMNSRLQLVNGRAINFVAVLDARINRKSWEAYAAATYPSLDLPQSVRDVLAAWPPSKGIYNEPVDSDIKVYSPTPQLSSIYPYLLAPAWQVVPVNTAIIIMQNEHSPGPRMIAIDQAVQSLKPALSDFVVLYSDVNIFRPSSIVYVPIISMTNESKVLGLTNLVYSWDILMSGSLPSYIGGVECVIKSSSSGNSFTFGISGSNVTIKSTGDTHDTRYDNLVSRFSIQIDAAQEYTIFLYPTSKLQDSYQSSTPLMSLLVIICGIGGTAFVFFLYERSILDLEIFNRAKERASLLKAKADSELARIVDTASTPIFSLDVNANILMWNKRLQELSGYPASEALGMNFLTSFVHTDHASKIQSVLTSAFIRGEGSENFELKLQLRSGETRILLVSSSVRRCVSDEVSSVVFVSSDDITALQEQRRSELKVHAEVEYTNFLAHEVRNPLTGIDCSSQNLTVDLNSIACSNCLSDKGVGFQPLLNSLDECEIESKHIHSCVGYILKILDNTLDVSRVTLTKTAVLLHSDVITPSLFMLQSLISKELAVKCTCDENIFVFADVLRLQQVVMNILTNAFKFAREGTVEVLVSIDASTHLVKIEIRDEGPGVAEENRDMLFSKYGQIEVRQGTGLGLSLSYQLVSAMSGRLYLDSSYSKGASFVVELPGGREDGAKAFGRRLSRKGSLYISNTGEIVFSADFVPLNLAVLLVDDSKAATRLLRRRLEMCSNQAKSWDYWAVAQTAEEALELCKQNGGAYDVIVMDQNMQAAGGVLLGHEAIRIMRQELHMTRTVIVGCSGNADTCEALFLEAGADDMWSKPTPPTVNMIRDLCRYRAARLSASPLVVGLPGKVQVLILHDNDHLFPDLCAVVPPSWGFHRSSGGHDEIASLASICQVTIIIDSLDSSALCGEETMRILRRNPFFLNGKGGIIILCVEDSEYEYAIKNLDANLILRKNYLCVDEVLRSFSRLLNCP